MKIDGWKTKSDRVAGENGRTVYFTNLALF
jgi:hypothetical protein